MQKTKEILQREYAESECQLVCVMSGDFVQRGMPAIFDKKLRTKHALLAGASAVLQLPVVFSCSAASFFAYGAIKLLSGINGLEYLSFGVETSETEYLQRIAEVLAYETQQMQGEIQALLCSGQSYPSSLAKTTVFECERRGMEGTIVEKILSTPNNLLAIEYLKWIIKLNLAIKPIFVARCDDGYHSEKPVTPFASASAIRKMISSSLSYEDFVPFERSETKVNGKVFDGLARLSLLKNEIFEKDMQTPLRNAAKEHENLCDIIESVKSKRYTYSHLQRLVLATILGIDKELMRFGGEFFAKLLGVKKDFVPFLSDLPRGVIVRKSDMAKLGKEAERILDKDIEAERIYSIICETRVKNFFGKLFVL
jgi:predicted nucleotidyltransferase